MERIPLSPPKILPITNGLHRPLWSVMIPVYNCSQYLTETIQSVLQQDMGIEFMQIEVVDDCSTDNNVEELVKKVGKGRVSYFRQNQNVGSLRNFETCINRSRGKYIHLLHGDDRVKKGYYSAIKAVFEKFPEAGAAFTSWDHIKSNGIVSRQSILEANEPCILDNWLYKLAELQRLQYVAITVKREVYEKLGSFYLAHYGEDWEMWARIAKDYYTAYVPEFLAEYREHKNSITWQSYQTGQNIKDFEKVITTIIGYLPKEDQRKMLKVAKKNFVYWMLDETLTNWFINKNKKMVYNQIYNILGLYRDKHVISRVAIILLYVHSESYRKTLKKIVRKLTFMPETGPYVIIHIQVDTYDFSVIPKLELGKRYYFVFWWLKIPLGDLYIDEADHANFSNKLLDSIIPTLKKYNDKDEEINGIIAAYKNSDILKLSTLIENIIAPYLALEIPNNVDISVVVCTRNRSESLKNCLDSLNNQICKAREIIVVDNAPTDNSTKLVSELYENVTYCKEPRPGLDIARNTGARMAKCPIVAYTDDDVSVDSLWCYRIWETFLQENIDAMTGLVLASSLETESQQIFEKKWGFNKGYQDIYFSNDFISESVTAPKVWDIGAGANMAFRKSAIEKVNYFDDRLDVGAAGCSGDSEIWFRILDNNMTIHYNPRAYVYHEHRKELKQLHKQLFGYMRGHAASVLIQHNQNTKIGYKKYLYYDIPRYYFFLIRAGFPNYNFRYQTLWSEIRGLISGVRFYNKNKHKPPLTF